MFTLIQLVKSFSKRDLKKFYTFFISHNEVVIGINFPKIVFLHDVCV